MHLLNRARQHHEPPKDFRDVRAHLRADQANAGKTGYAGTGLRANAAAAGPAWPA